MADGVDDGPKPPDHDLRKALLPAFIGLIGAILGAVVGGVITYLVTQRSVDATNETATRTLRANSYLPFLKDIDSIEILMARLIDDYSRPEGHPLAGDTTTVGDYAALDRSMAELGATWSPVEILATDQTRQNALAVFDFVEIELLPTLRANQLDAFIGILSSYRRQDLQKEHDELDDRFEALKEGLIPETTGETRTTTGSGASSSTASPPIT